MFPLLLRLVHLEVVARPSIHLGLDSMRVDMRKVDNDSTSPEEILGRVSVLGSEVPDCLTIGFRQGLII